MLHIVETVIDEELKFWNDAELFAHTGSKFITYLSDIGVDVLHYLLGLLAWEDTEIDAAHAHIGTNAASTDADQNTPHRARLLLENVAQLFLNEPSYLILSGCFHLINLQFDDLQFRIYLQFCNLAI